MADERDSSGGPGSGSEAAQTDPAHSPFHYVHSLGLPGLLEQLQCTLVATTYQAGKLVVLRARAGRLSMLPRTFEQAMGVAVSPSRLAVGTRYQIWILENNADLAHTVDPAASHDACYLPRYSHVTGNIHIHEMAWGAPTQERKSGTELHNTTVELWFVNTLFSCLSTLHSTCSFMPQWQPPFITEIAPQDRCHLNGLAMEHSRPKYVTAFAESDVPDGWRDEKSKTGCVIDVTSGETVARGLSMPHSPRLHKGQLYVLDSGKGRLVKIDPANGRVDVVTQLPGYTRGLTFCDRYAFVGLSKIRETTTFGGVPIAEFHDELKCGIWVVDVTTGSVASFLEFKQEVMEIFDVQIMPGLHNPSIIGLKKDTIQGTFVLPSK